MEYRRLGRFINLSLVAAFTTLFAIQVAAQPENGGDVQYGGDQYGQEVSAQSADEVDQDAAAQPTESGEKSFLEKLLEASIGVAEQAMEVSMDRKTREAQGFYKGKIESINVVEQRGNSVTADIAYKDVKQHEGMQLRVNVLSAGSSHQELSNFQGNIVGSRGVARVVMYWSNPLNQSEIKTDQLEVTLYRDTGGLEESIDIKYADLRKTWTPFDEVVDSSGQIGALDLDDEPANVEDLGGASRGKVVVTRTPRAPVGGVAPPPRSAPGGVVAPPPRSAPGGVVAPPPRSAPGGVVAPPPRSAPGGVVRHDHRAK